MHFLAAGVIGVVEAVGAQDELWVYEFKISLLGNPYLETTKKYAYKYWNRNTGHRRGVSQTDAEK